MPLLILAGARDRLVDHRCSLTLARAWQADIAVHPEGGHDVPLDQGQWVVQQIRDWVREDKPAAGSIFGHPDKVREDCDLGVNVGCRPKAAIAGYTKILTKRRRFSW